MSSQLPANTSALPFPVEILAQHLVVLGKTGAGKSSKLRIIVEYLLDNNDPVCIIDPKGDWWGLRASADGKREGYPVVIFGGEHADVPMNAQAGAAVAKLVATGNRPCVIDLGGWSVGDRTRFFIDFASTLFRASKGMRHLVIDECHNFAPQGKVLSVDAGKALHWANRLASEGRGKGIRLLGASQRPQKVHKDFLTSCETLIACRVIHPLDRKAIKDWLDGAGDDKIAASIINSLAGMAREDAFVWCPEEQFGPEKITFPMFSTYDSFSPRTVEDSGEMKGWAAIDLDEIKQHLNAAVEEHAQNDPVELKKRIAELESQVRRLSASNMSGEELNRRIQLAVEQDRASRAHIDEKLQRALESIRLTVDDALVASQETIQVSMTPGAVDPGYYYQAPNDRSIGREIDRLEEKLSPTSRKIIDTIHRSHPVALTFEAAATRAGVSKRSSAFNKYRKEVNASSEIEIRDDGRLTSAPGFSAPIGPGVDPIEEFSKKLPPSYARMLRAIAAARVLLTKDEIADMAEVSSTSSGLSAGLKELVALGLVEVENGLYRLTPELGGQV